MSRPSKYLSTHINTSIPLITGISLPRCPDMKPLQQTLKAFQKEAPAPADRSHNIE